MKGVLYEELGEKVAVKLAILGLYALLDTSSSQAREMPNQYHACDIDMRT